MTWQVGSALVLLLALGVGFAWYERSRPLARVLALVAALGALGAIGRVAFAAFPNVKPTSDIVLFSGYALGGPAGFAVGAVSALVSNVFLGQGPWTPWQMAAWGIVGLLGAGVGRMLRGREPSRLLLAGICGFAGFLFGALMDVYQWTFAAEHTLSSYLAVSATSLAFNIAHATGNVVFALILGPAFIRALERYRRRFEVTWLAAPPRAARGVAVLLAFVALTAAAPPQAARAASPDAPAIAAAVHYLRFSQNPDGGFGPARHQSSTTLHTGWTALGLAAARLNPRDVTQHGHSVLGYVSAHAGSLGDVGELERTMLVLRAAGAPQRLAGHNLLAALIRKQGGDGSFDTLNHTAFGVLALRAAGRTTRSKEVRAAVHVLLRAQNPDGGFGFARHAASDVDDTGAVLQSLAAGGHRSSPVVSRAVAYLRKAQRPDGGFAQMAIGDSNAQSTAFAVQGLVAAGRDPSRFKRTRTPVEYLRSLQAPDGSVRYSRTSSQTPVWVTAEALVALERKPYPLRPAPRNKARTATVATATPTATTTSTAATPSATPKSSSKSSPSHARRHHVARAAVRPRSNTMQVKIKPVAQTTTQTSTASGGSGGNRDRNWWPYVFAVVLAVLILVGLRLAWRRA